MILFKTNFLYPIIAKYIQDLVSIGNSWKSDNEDESNKEKTPFLSSDKESAEATVKEIPKYLELIYESEPPLENDGYEIPNQMIAGRNNSESVSASNTSSFISKSNNNLVHTDK